MFTTVMRDNVVPTEGQSFKRRIEGNDKEYSIGLLTTNEVMMTTTLLERIVVYLSGSLMATKWLIAMAKSTTDSIPVQVWIKNI